MLILTFSTIFYSFMNFSEFWITYLKKSSKWTFSKNRQINYNFGCSTGSTNLSFFIFFEKSHQDEIRIGFYLSEALANRSWRIHWPRPTIAVNWQRTFCCSHRRLGWHRKHFCNRWLKPDDISLDHQYPKPKEKSIQKKFVKMIYS